ncbi:protein-glutamate methylesterase/protein-glutamine glutaminase [Clostridium botulinum]|uniref:protein-glutamate methylesterase/protein-glutamine glutaminase n=1 Tax=Clostridium botulinum TaxID=1491 RepID=UPI000774A7DF|nr:chemotaxis response regulator protein-glutamate methylesterase [Clostridium botulinum]
MNKIKVLVVDDSALMRKIVSDMINEENDLEVIDTARNGEDLLEKLKRIKPNIITLDVEMPKMDGIEALINIKRIYKDIPVIMLSSLSKKGAGLTMDCLQKGAFDFVPKPSGAISLDINKVKEELVEKIRAATNAIKNNHTSDILKTDEKINVKKAEEKRYPIKNTVSSKKVEAVVIGASTGGPKALYSVITALPEKIDVPVFVVQHMPKGFTKAFSERLNANSKLKVVEGQDGQTIEKDTVYVAPGGFHMEVGKDRKIHLNIEPTLWGVRPAVDKLFKSASEVYGSNLISVVLTGMGRDGADGTAYIKDRGGITISEDESTCTIYGMPKATYETGKVDFVVPLYNVTDTILKNI